MTDSASKIWEPGSFLIAASFGMPPRQVSGYVYRGLGLHMAIAGSPKGRRPPVWMLTHCGSGHAVAKISGHVRDAFLIATQIVDCGDWTFDGLDGWKNLDPELPDKAMAIIRANKGVTSRLGASNADEQAARAVALARSA